MYSSIPDSYFRSKKICIYLKGQYEVMHLRSNYKAVRAINYDDTIPEMRLELEYSDIFKVCTHSRAHLSDSVYTFLITAKSDV
jgi:hypothetical protein